jgi:VanZ family protein
MQRSKKIFLVIALVFLAIVIAIVIDFSQKTTFPGKKSPSEGSRP